MNLEEEIIWGHKVTPQTKRIWSIEIDIAKKLLEVCNKNSLKIWTCYGTLLGAVRHKGFIPWDDDMDFVMFRDDYERLKKIASSEFSYPYFFQSFYSDAFWGGMSRVVRSDTTMVEEGYQHQNKRNTGIWVDIFVLDGVPNDIEKFQKTKKRLSFFRRIVNNYKVFNPRNSSFSSRIKHAIICSFCKIVNVDVLQKCIVKTLSASHISECDKIAPIDMSLSWGEVCQSRALEKVCFRDSVMLSFHDISIPVPIGYHEVLAELYGDYMKPVKGVELHKIEIVDCDKPYDKLH